MIEVYGNIWHLPGDAICITTNGSVKANGDAVMGKGIALELAKSNTTFPRRFGERLRKEGNHVLPFFEEVPHYDGESGDIWTQDIAVFPVKHNWWEMADLELIRRSCHELMYWINELGYWKTVLLPRPGCGAGKLKWEDVKKEIEPLLDNRVSVVTFYES